MRTQRLEPASLCWWMIFWFVLFLMFAKKKKRTLFFNDNIHCTVLNPVNCDALLQALQAIFCPRLLTISWTVFRDCQLSAYRSEYTCSVDPWQFIAGLSENQIACSICLNAPTLNSAPSVHHSSTISNLRLPRLVGPGYHESAVSRAIKKSCNSIRRAWYAWGGQLHAGSELTAWRSFHFVAVARHVRLHNLSSCCARTNEVSRLRPMTWARDISWRKTFCYTTLAPSTVSCWSLWILNVCRVITSPSTRTSPYEKNIQAISAIPSMRTSEMSFSALRLDATPVRAIRLDSCSYWVLS